LLATSFNQHLHADLHLIVDLCFNSICGRKAQANVRFNTAIEPPS